jgi:hypothetical protein
VPGNVKSCNILAVSHFDSGSKYAEGVAELSPGLRNYPGRNRHMTFWLP